MPFRFPYPITSTVVFAMNTKVIYVYESQMCIILLRVPALDKCLLLLFFEQKKLKSMDYVKFDHFGSVKHNSVL